MPGPFEASAISARVRLQDASLWDITTAPTIVMTQRGARAPFQVHGACACMASLLGGLVTLQLQRGEAERPCHVAVSHVPKISAPSTRVQGKTSGTKRGRQKTQ